MNDVMLPQACPDLNRFVRNLCSIVLIKLVVPKSSGMMTVPNFCDILNLLRIECKGEHPQHITHPLFLARGRDWNNTHVDGPS